MTGIPFAVKPRGASLALLLILAAQARPWSVAAQPADAQPQPPGAAAPPAAPAPAAPEKQPEAKPQDGAGAPQPTPRAQPLPPIPVKTSKPKPPRPQPARRARVPAGVPATAPAPAARATTRPAPAAAQPQPQLQPQPADDRPGAVGGVGEAAGATLGSNVVKADIPITNNTADILRAAPGVSVYQGGGVSDLPVVQGLNDERVNTTLNGMAIASACANHMNPALSYVDPSAVRRIEVIAGVSPVSAGGDSLGSVIAVEKAVPAFTERPGETIAHGSASAYLRSASRGIGGSANASVAAPAFVASYAGAWTRAADYLDGHGDTVKSTLYEAQNHALSLGFRGGSDVFVVDAGFQRIPYEGFVNQWMDLVSNEAWYVNGRYERKLDWGKLYAQAYYQHVAHEMEFLPDKKVGRALMNAMPDMPMLTDGVNVGASMKAEIPLEESDLLRVGADFHVFALDDWWPPVPNSRGQWVPSMMCCNTFWNIHGGQRNRVGAFLEWESRWSRAWKTLVGLRNDAVWMNTGDVEGYSARFYGADAARFNARDHAKTDVNFDVTATARYEPEPTDVYEFGFAHKTRSPNLYERYAWSTNPMAMSMNGWFGDSNGYVGDLGIDPESANTASVTAGWRDAAGKDWQFKITPYFTYVQDYIHVDKIADNCPVARVRGVCTFLPKGDGTNALLRFANHDAELFGVDAAGSKLLWDSPDYGRFSVNGVAGFVRGMTVSAGDSLYHMMPLNARINLEQKWGQWTNVVELQLVSEKVAVDPLRKELTTGGYGLVNVRSSYEWEHLRLDFGVENILDAYYQPPLGGIDIGMQPLIFPVNMPVHNVPGMGRNVYVGLTAKF